LPSGTVAPAGRSIRAGRGTPSSGHEVRALALGHVLREVGQRAAGRGVPPAVAVVGADVSTQSSDVGSSPQLRVLLGPQDPARGSTGGTSWSCSGPSGPVERVAGPVGRTGCVAVQAPLAVLTSCHGRVGPSSRGRRGCPCCVHGGEPARADRGRCRRRHRLLLSPPSAGEGEGDVRAQTARSGVSRRGRRPSYSTSTRLAPSKTRVVG